MDYGLVSAVILDGSGGARRIDWGEVRSWTASQGTLWVHLDRREPGAVAWLESDAGLLSLPKTPSRREVKRLDVRIADRARRLRGIR